MTKRQLIDLCYGKPEVCSKCKRRSGLDEYYQQTREIKTKGVRVCDGCKRSEVKIAIFTKNKSQIGEIDLVQA